MSKLTQTYYMSSAVKMLTGLCSCKVDVKGSKQLLHTTDLK